MNIKQAIHDQLMHQGLTKADLCRAGKINYSWFSAWFSGNRGKSITLDKLQKISIGLNMKTSQLIKKAENID